MKARKKPHLKRKTKRAPVSRARARNGNFRKKPKAKGKQKIPLEKFAGNPIVQPDENHAWESKATFNAAALYENGKVHILYRAIGDSDVSVLGYASSGDGLNIIERLAEPAYVERRTSASEKPEEPPSRIFYISGGGWGGGAEDPRLTAIDEKIYLLYTSFDGWGSVRIALTSIGLQDFLEKKWNWKPPVLISPPGEIHKNWVLFPEKINGRYAILHSISPEIRVDYFDNLDYFDGTKYIENSHRGEGWKKKRWDSQMRGAGPPPLKTKDGWLLFYHGIDRSDPGKYKLGAMLLDLKDPAKVLCRSKTPVLEPDELYENEGFKGGVVYSCGAVIMGGNIFIYYGGADSVVCVATADLDEFLKDLKRSKVPVLKKMKLPHSRD